jgi:hypothetical protein
MAYQELQRVAVGNRPESTLYSNGSIWCANVFANTVTRVNPSTGAVVATIAVNPSGTTTSITEDNFGNVWVSSTAAGGGSVYGLHRIDPATNAVDQQLEINTGYASVSFADGDLIVSRSGGAGVTSRVDTTTFAFTNISKAVPRGYSDGPQTANFDGTLLWLTNFANDAVYSLDSTNAYVSTITGISDPRQSVYAFGYLWVCSRGASATDGFWRINVSTNALTNVISTGVAGVTFDANYLYVANGTVVRRVDPSSLAVSALFTDVDIVFDPVVEGNRIWYASANTDELVQIGPVGGIFTDGAKHL